MSSPENIFMYFKIFNLFCTNKVFVFQDVNYNMHVACLIRILHWEEYKINRDSYGMKGTQNGWA